MYVHNRKSRVVHLLVICLLTISWGFCAVLTPKAQAQIDDSSAPPNTVKLIFIHHSCGQNWLADEHGKLGLALEQNNYFVSDTYYGWGPDSIGDRTDILNWTEWFRGPNSERYLTALYNESGQTSYFSRGLPDPGGENEIILFKSCYPNSNLKGRPNDSAKPGSDLTVSNAKFIYNDLLNYFITRPDKLFVVITAPPVLDPQYADNARAFNTWLVQDWLAENNYPLNNVAVFDFYNVLTHPDNHHQFTGQEIEYVTSHGNNTLFFDSNGDNHPNPIGNQKATSEFVPLLNVFYNRWSPKPELRPSDEKIETPETTEFEETLTIETPISEATMSSDPVQTSTSQPAIQLSPTSTVDSAQGNNGNQTCPGSLISGLILTIGAVFGKTIQKRKTVEKTKF